MSRFLLVGLLLIVLFTHTALGAPPPQGNLLFLGIALNQRGVRGAWAQVGEPEAWKNARAGAIFQDRLFTAEKDGFLWVSDLDTGERARLGKPDFAATTFLFAGHDSLYSIESDGNLYRIAPANGAWVQIGANGIATSTIAGTLFRNLLFTVHKNGTLHETDLSTGRRRQIGKADFAATTFLFATADALLSIESDGTLYRVDPRDGSWRGIPPDAGWKKALAGTVFKGRLYTAESDGTLRGWNPVDGVKKQIGNADFGTTRKMFAASQAIFTLENDGSLYLVNVLPPEGLDAYDCFPREYAKAFREQSREFWNPTESRLILGKQATRPGIMEGFAWLKAKATAGDLGVVYLTCHGGIDPQKGWGVETFDNDTVWGGEIKAALAGVPCQILLFIETCASGGFVRANSRDRPVPDNVSVFCACSGRQVTTNELDIASLEALYGRADADGDGIVTLGELTRYVPERYKELDAPGKANARNAPVIARSKAMPDSLPLTRVSPALSAVVHDGELWSALLTKRDGDRFKVHLIGWNNTRGKPYFLTDEVSRDCICLPTEGIPLLVKQDDTWYPARLLGRIEEKYEIHYLGFKEDEVVTADRIRYPFAGRAR